MHSILVLNTNVATPSLGARVIAGTNGDRLLRDDSTKRNENELFCSHSLNVSSEGIVVELGRPYIINYVEVSE